ncbi:MAG: MFS transporter [Tepidiformaceae bacterium]
MPLPRTFPGRLSTFASLENPQFRLLFYGNIFSFLGMQMQVIARGFLAFDLTGKNSALGGVMLAFGLPQLLLSLWGGVIADRLPKRRILMVCQLIIASNSAWLATMIAIGNIEYWMLLVAGVVQGAGFAFIGPARQAFISDLVDREHLGNAVVLQQLSMNSTRVIGPSIAGMFIAVHFIGTAGVYYITTLGFLVATVMMLRLPAGNPRPRAHQVSPLGDLLEGVRYVTARRNIGLLILASFAVVMVGFPYQSFLPSIAEEVYGVGAGGLGALSSVSAVGAVAATIVVASITQRRSFVLQPLAGIGFGLSLIAFGAAPSFLTGMIVIVFVGGLASAFQSLNNSLVMTLTDYDYHGRVQSMNMLSWSLFGLAALPIGIIADRIGIRETLVFQGALCVIAVAAIEVVRRTGGGPVAIPAPAIGAAVHD